MKWLLFFIIFPVHAEYLCELSETDAQCATRYGQDNVLYVDGVYGLGSGSGVRISDTQALTAAHVSEAIMPVFDGVEPESAGVHDEDLDISLYVVNLPGSNNYAEIEDTMPPAGTVVYSLGYPGGLDFTMFSGYWMGDVEGIEHIGYTTVQIYPGNSGGALVYVTKGYREVKLLGLTNWGAGTDTDEHGMQASWALRSDYILDFLERL